MAKRKLGPTDFDKVEMKHLEQLADNLRKQGVKVPDQGWMIGEGGDTHGFGKPMGRNWGRYRKEKH